MLLSGTQLPPWIQPDTADVLSMKCITFLFFKNLWMIPRAQQASKGFESADILFTRHKLL